MRASLRSADSRGGRLHQNHRNPVTSDLVIHDPRNRSSLLREIQPTVVVEIPCRAGGCIGRRGVLRLRKPLASPMSRFAQDDTWRVSRCAWPAGRRCAALKAKAAVSTRVGALPAKTRVPRTLHIRNPPADYRCGEKSHRRSWWKFPAGPVVVSAGEGSFDCASHWLRQCLASLRMTELRDGLVGTFPNRHQRQRQRTGVSVPRGRRFAALTAEAAVST
jgi:hypothetical protein